MSKRKDTMRLAAKFSVLQPMPHEEARGLWSAMVNALTGSGLIKEEHIRDFRDFCGWDLGNDLVGAVPQEARKEQIGATEGPRLGDGSGDAALAIGEHAFYAGFDAGFEAGRQGPLGENMKFAAWDAYEPSEDIKELS